MSQTVSVTADGFVEQEMLEDNAIEARDYQLDLLEAARSQDSLVVLPTGLGKTPIAVMLAAERYAANPDRKILMLAPTKPLVEQHVETFCDFFWINDDRVVMFTGETSPSKREELWASPDTSIVVATPQCLKNDVVGNRIDLSDVMHLIFDECHRATGDYAYNDIADRYNRVRDGGVMTALSASPGSSKTEVLRVCHNLGLDAVHVKTEDDPSVDEFNPETVLKEHWVDLADEMTEVRDLLVEVFQHRLEQVKNMGVINTKAKSTSNKKIQQAKGNARDLINSNDSSDQSKGYKALSVLTEAQYLNTAIQNIESRGPQSCQAFFEKLEDKDSKASERMLEDDRVVEARRMLQDIDRAHPKMIDLMSLTMNTIEDDGQVITFADSRQTVEFIVDYLDEFGVSAKRFVGQSDTKASSGMTQADQKERLDSFRAGEFDVLVATSVAEEGLDIPSVDLVMFYEPVASPVRAVQRKGRTGRETQGHVSVMLTRDTREVGKWYALKNREDTMEEEMKNLREIASIQDEINAELGGLADEGGDEDTSVTLDSFNEEDDESTDEEMAEEAEAAKEEASDIDTEVVGTDDDGRATVLSDTRETQSDVLPALNKIDETVVELETLDIGDYVLSSRTAVERKSMEDFLDTLTGGDRDLFEQLADLSNNYSRPILLLEGDMDELFLRNIHKNAIYGALVTATTSFGVSIMHSRDQQETAMLLARMAIQEQTDDGSEVAAHGSKSGRTRAEQKEYVVSSVANIGPVTARALLEHFGSVHDVLTASTGKLQEVEGVGKKTAKQLRELIDEEYDPVQ